MLRGSGAGTLGVLLGVPGMSGNFWGSQVGCQGSQDLMAWGRWQVIYMSERVKAVEINSRGGNCGHQERVGPIRGEPECLGTTRHGEVGSRGSHLVAQ